MAALFILANANVESEQRIFILAIVVPKNACISPRSSIEEFVKSVQYESIAFVIRHNATSPPLGHALYLTLRNWPNPR